MYDKTMFLSQATVDKNTDIATMMFQLNKKLDNVVNYMLVDLVMDSLSEALHLQYSHKTPILADHFSDYCSLYGYKINYNTVQAEIKQYSSLMESIVDVLDYIVDIDNAFSEGINLGMREQNYDYVKFLFDELIGTRKLKKQFILLHDKVEKALEAGNTLQDIDFNYDKFFIPYE